MISKGVEMVFAGGRRMAALVGRNRVKVSTVVVLLLIGLAVMTCAQAETASISFTRPTQYTNGQPLAPSSITGFEFRCGTGTTVGVTCTTLTLPGTATAGTMSIAVLVDGGTACIEGRTRVAAGPGPYSSQACKVFPAWTPNAPTTITVVVVTE